MNWVHKNFQLNGQSLSTKDEVLAYAKNSSISLHDFLLDWFSDEDFILVKTSGSTGTPKNIKLKKEFMVNSALATGNFFELKENTSALCCLPIDFIAGKMMLIRAITLGWHLDYIESTSIPLEHIDKEYDFSAMVPLQVHHSIKKLYFIQKLIVGGGVVSKELQQELLNVSTEVYATYGMTETITHIAVKKLNHDFWNSYRVLPNVFISTDDRSCLVINAPNLAEEEIVTNDVVKLISENKFEWKGRYDNVINSGGIKLHPEEIERKLSNHFTNRFFVAGVPDEKLGEKLVLIIEGEKFTVNEDAYSELVKYERPKQVFFIRQFLETETGKIQRKQILKQIALF